MITQIAMDPLILNALNCTNAERPPVWFMRQAGRYLPEYRSLRAKYSLLELFHRPELAAEITLQPIERLGVDAAILFSDILVILETFGMTYDFHEGTGPVIHQTVASSRDVEGLVKKNVDETLDFVRKIIRLLIPQLKVPLLGFCGGPFTIASYLIEGGSSRDFKKVKQWLYCDPQSFHLLLKKITEVTIEYLKLQVDAGVRAVQIFDSWANMLGYSQFMECSHHYLKLIVDGLKAHGIPVILFCRGASIWSRELAKLQPAAISFDWNCNLAQQRREVGRQIALQGNLDPAIFYGSEKMILDEAGKLLESMKGDRGFIFNLGHGILPDTPVEKVKLLVDFVKETSRVTLKE